MKDKIFSSIVPGSLILTALLATGCGDKDFNPKQIKTTAPNSETSTGISITGADAKSVQALLEKYSEAKIRVINPKHKVYEIFNLSLEKIKQELPQASVHKNKFIQRQNLNHKKLTLSYYNKLVAQQDKSAEDELNECQRSDDGPIPQISILEPIDDLKDGIVDVGVEVSLDGSQSKSKKGFESQLKHIWIVSPPQGSLQEETVHLGPSVKVQPDTMGMYSILLVVQDEHKFCGGKSFSLAVTKNRAFKGHTPEDELKANRLQPSLFEHLSELHAEASWGVSTGQGVTIAIIDSGVNYNHFALSKNILTNTKEIPGNGIDDDENGFIDDYVGYDFANSDAYPFDDHGHGTHVAGLAASSIFGLAKNAKILSLKAMGLNGGDIASIVGAIYYAVDRGAQVINMSLGSYGYPHPQEIEAVNYAESKGVIIVVAAGNGHPVYRVPVNTDKMPHYPSALPNDNIISVASKSFEGLLAPYSNFGVDSVDVVAPGGMGPHDLLSAYMENAAGYEFVGMSGTSMASPVVAGITAQIMSLNPNLSVAEVKELLMSAGEKIEGLSEKVRSGRYIDALSALELTQQKLNPLNLVTVSN